MNTNKNSTTPETKILRRKKKKNPFCDNPINPRRTKINKMEEKKSN